MLNGTEKVPALITDFKEYHTDTTVRFVIKMTAEKLQEAEAAGLHKVFKLQSPLTCNSMVMVALHKHTTSALMTGEIKSFCTLILNLKEFKDALPVCLFFCLS